ncbi:PadR family transcriptional regulator [Demequina sp.]|uniref:PadR family transcriptional regulator n=1 Tax=Demequina sp. TaxID=2050685 RepID=UPI003D0B5160
MKDMKYGGRNRHHHDFESHHEGFGPRGRKARFGPGGFGSDGFGPGPGFGPGRGPGRGPRGGRNRGDVRTAVIVLLAEQPRHGYDLMRAIEERSNGMWSPSPGSIYPTLQALEDEGLIQFETVEGRKTASLTEAGSQWLAEHGSEADTVFTQPEGASSAIALRQEMHQLRDAAMLAARQGGDTAEEAVKVIAQARKDLYALLAGQ